MPFRPFAALLLGTLLLSACGGGTVEDSRLRVVNATANYAAIDVYVDDDREFVGVASGQASGWRGFASDTYSMAFGVPGSGTLVGTADRRLSGDEDHTLVAHGREGQFKSTLLVEDGDRPDSGRARLRVLHGAADAGSLDVYLADDCRNLGGASPLAAGIAADTLTPFATVLTGSYRLCVTRAGDTAELRLDSDTLVLGSRDVATVVLTPTEGGVLVGAVVLPQGEAARPLPAAHKRVRVVTAITGNPPISVDAGEVPLAMGLGSPAIGSYILVPANVMGLIINVDGTPPAGRPELPIGGGRDITVLVYGSAADPQTAVLVDDNRLPVSSSTARIRLVHGLAGLNEPLTMKLGLVQRGSAGPGSASAAVQVPAANDQELRVESSSPPPLRYRLSDLDVESGRVYTVFLLGDANSESTTVGIVNADR